MCEMFQPVDETVLAEVVIDNNSDILAQTVTLDDIDINNIDSETTLTFAQL